MIVEIILIFKPSFKFILEYHLRSRTVEHRCIASAMITGISTLDKLTNSTPAWKKVLKINSRTPVARTVAGIATPILIKKGKCILLTLQPCQRNKLIMPIIGRKIRIVVKMTLGKTLTHDEILGVYSKRLIIR